MAELLFPGARGCSGAVFGYGGVPRACDVPPTLTVEHEYSHPRPHARRLPVCPAHAEGEPDPQPITAEQLADLAGRKRRREEARERAERNRRPSAP